MIFIGIGSSIGNAKTIFEQTEKDLNTMGVLVIKKSKILKNPPYGGVAQNEFSNAVWQIETKKNPNELLRVLQETENLHGRKRRKKWDDRTLDLDILIYHNEIINTPNLKIPHPEISKRDFVLKPLSEIVGKDFEIQNFGKINELLKKLASSDRSDFPF